jgi:3-dehydroquinate synthase
MDSFELRTATGVVPIRLARADAAWIANELNRIFGIRRPRLMLVTDENVALHHLEPLKSQLARDGFSCEEIVLPPGEEQKNLKRVKELLDILAQKRFARDDVIIALGGGVITDLAGFVASIYLRGVEWIALPTTLLGMVDASIGGKTGVNHELGKNMIGAFHQPKCVLANHSYLETLAPRELRAGAAEIIKGALLVGGEFWREIEIAGADALHWNPRESERFIARGAAVKIDIVSRDERESGERMLLNLGHTFGHALEQVAGYGTLTHGEAVFYGLRAAIKLSDLSGLLSPQKARALEKWLSSISLPKIVCSEDELIAATKSDKKTASNKQRWILLRDVGKPVISHDVPEQSVQECAAWLSEITRSGEEAVAIPRRRRVAILNGPNLNLLGTREPSVYGNTTYEELVAQCLEWADDVNLELLVRQSNHEGEYSELIQWSRRWADGLILNPGALTHTSVSVRDALAAANLPAVEVHLSDPQAREDFRHTSLISDLCRKTIAGKGIQGYRLALMELAFALPETV